ncbi:fungal-specific transcription factor domain-containing protein [Hypoxylon sp. FL1284]|nr:fungal-specific transcription factor domain-containing protein [Hypoxylon sp. FL1284]
MFTTFVGMAPGAAESSAPASPEAPQPPKPRPKRSQVARACDWCRVHRIKCDNHLPCANCQKRRGQCSQGAIEVRTLPHAYRKIERLENRVRELEQELEVERRGSKGINIGLNTPLTTPPSLASCGGSGPESTGGTFGPPSDHGNPERKRLEGIHIRATRSQQETWYGPSSLFYFIRRVNTYLNTSLRQTRSINHMLPDSANKLYDGPGQNSAKDLNHRSFPTPGGFSVSQGDYLTPTQEEYFIGLFWQSFHTSIPVLDEVAFKEHYQSLWTTSGRERKPSALVDIVIALCVQYGVALQPGSGQGTGSAEILKLDSHDATIAGRWHFQRCQSLLTSELENPTIFTLQCHILSTVYLCSGAFPNMSDSTCTLAVRTAFMLGLHVDPPPEMPQREREMRKRLWWTLFVLDSKISMKLGRPFLIDQADTTCGVPGDDREVATASGTCLAPLGEDVTWLTFNVHNAKLFQAARAAYTAFYKKQLETPYNSGDRLSEEEEGRIIESHADYLAPYIERMEDWVKNVPSAIKTKRQDGGIPFSTDSTPLDIEQFASLWLQRQRLLLELMYHNLCINLFRPFIRFSTPTIPTPEADRLAAECAGHAIQLTRIMHQVLSSTSILTGWHESFQWQWNAVMSLIGFVIAYPQDASTPAAKSAIDLTADVFEIFGKSLASAASATAISRDLRAQAEMLTKATPNEQQQQQQQQELMQKMEESPLTATSWGTSGDETLVSANSTAMPTPNNNTWGFDEGMGAPLHGLLTESMDMAFPMDAQDFQMFPWLNMSGDPAIQWSYYQQQV